jgi:hypothetical protein
MDSILNAADLATLNAEMTRLGLHSNAGVIGGYPYYMNLGSSTHPGVWARLRVNGPTMPTFSNGVTQYSYSSTLDGWTSDGSTLAPSWVGDIAVIA